MKIAILGLNYAPEAIGIGPYTTGLAEWLAQQGHAVEVVAGRPYYPDWRARSGYRFWWNRRQENGVTVTRCPHYIPERPSGLHRMIHHASFVLASLGPMVGAVFGRPQIVMCIAPSLLSVPVAWLVARLAGAKLWLHIQDFEVEAALATGLLSRGSRLARLGLAVEGWLLRRADLVSTISPQMCMKLRDKGVASQKIAELRNWANHLERIGQGDGARFRAAWRLEEKFVVLYSGNIANKQGIEIVIEAARELANESKIAFVICGDGPNQARLEQNAHGLANIQFHPLQPEEDFGDLMCCADVHVLPQLADAADLVLPSKLANMLASARPVIATGKQGTGLAAEIEGCGLVVTPGDAGALAAAIRSLANDPERCRQLGEAGERRAHARWHKQAVLAAVDGLIARLVASPG